MAKYWRRRLWMAPYTKSQFYKSSEVDKNLVVDISSVKLVDKSSVLIENTVKLEELDEKAVVYQSLFSLIKYVAALRSNKSFSITKSGLKVH